MSETNIMRFSLHDLDERLRSGLVVMDAERVNKMTEDEIERLAIEENARLGFSDDWHERIPIPHPAEASEEPSSVFDVVAEHSIATLKSLPKSVDEVVSAPVRAYKWVVDTAVSDSTIIATVL